MVTVREAVAEPVGEPFPAPVPSPFPRSLNSSHPTAIRASAISTMPTVSTSPAFPSRATGAGVPYGAACPGGDACAGCARYGSLGVSAPCPWCATTVGVSGPDTGPSGARTVPPAPTTRSIRAASAAGSRSAGSLRSSPSSTGASAPARRGGGNSVSTTARRVSSGVACRKGETPSTAVYSMIPSAHRSEAGPGSRPDARSGARNSGEPTTSPVMVIEEEPSRVAIPKSPSTTRPSLAIRTLPGFTSRCSTPESCAARSAASTCSPMCAAR